MFKFTRHPTSNVFVAERGEGEAARVVARIVAGEILRRDDKPVPFPHPKSEWIIEFTGQPFLPGELNTFLSELFSLEF